MTDENKKLENIDKSAKHSKRITILILVAIPALLVISSVMDSLWLRCAAIGALGGILHDIVQNNGFVAYAYRTKEGVRLGLGLAAIIGGICGFLVYPTVTPPTDLITPFTAGLAFKGIGEAIGAKGSKTVEEE
jgi:hypothetical protein